MNREADIKKLRVFFNSETGYRFAVAREAFERLYPDPDVVKPSPEPDSDAEAYARGDTMHYEGLAIVPKRDWSHLVPLEDRKGWVVVGNGCNVLPGATWTRTRSEAMKAANIWLMVRDLPDPDKKFWYFLRALQYATGELKA